MVLNRFYNRCAIVALLGILTLPFTALSEPAMAQTTAILRVDGDVTTSGDGSAWGNNNAIKYLQDALDEAFDLIENQQANDVEIWVADGTYYPNEASSPTNNDCDETFTLLNNVEIYGAFHGDGGEDDLTDRDIAGNAPAILSGDIDQAGGLSGNAYHVVTIPLNESRSRIDGKLSAATAQARATSMAHGATAGRRFIAASRSGERSFVTNSNARGA